MPVCKKCEKKFPNKVMVDGKERNLQNRKYCLTCSPFGLHNTRQLENKSKGSKFCTKCSQEKPLTDFYKRRNGNDQSPYCKSCTINQTLERQRAFKKKCVEYKGEKCVRCGYNKCIGALEFHHLNPKDKDFSPSSARLRGETKGELKEEIKKELDKCILVCANCHREEHEKIYKMGAVGLEPTGSV